MGLKGAEGGYTLNFRERQLARRGRRVVGLEVSCVVRRPGEDEEGERERAPRRAGLSMAEGDTLVSVDYEVFGKVQGVFFRKYTQAEGKKLGLVGWVQNTDRGTVQGQLQGPRSKVHHMQEWLETKGSPKSHIERANFNNEKAILKLDYSDFQIVK